MPPATNGQLATLQCEWRVCRDRIDFNPAEMAFFDGGAEQVEQAVSESI